MEHMMLLVTYRMLPGQRDAFLQEVAAAGILAKVQQEDGFERYDYYLSAADPDELLIVEEWDSEAQQQAPVPAQDWAPGGSNQTEDAPKPVTLSELQALGRKVALAGHQDVLAKVLAKYGASNLSSVPEESRAAALADLEAANG